jgi:hypothetical protein
VGKEAAVSTNASGRIVYRFHARDVNLIMGPETLGTPVRFRVRMYQLIRQSQRVVDRLFEIEFLDPGAQAFDFTFG